MPEPVLSPLARIVLLMVCLSIAGNVVAGAHYYTIDLPIHQAVLRAPAKGAGNSDQSIVQPAS